MKEFIMKRLSEEEQKFVYCLADILVYYQLKVKNNRLFDNIFDSIQKVCRTSTNRMTKNGKRQKRIVQVMNKLEELSVDESFNTDYFAHNKYLLDTYLIPYLNSQFYNIDFRHVKLVLEGLLCAIEECQHYECSKFTIELVLND